MDELGDRLYEEKLSKLNGICKNCYIHKKHHGLPPRLYTGHHRVYETVVNFHVDVELQITQEQNSINCRSGPCCIKLLYSV